MKKPRVIQILLSWLLILFSTSSLGHYCPQLNKKDSDALAETNKVIEIHRTEPLYSVNYTFKAPRIAGSNVIKAVLLRFGFGAHPEGTVRLHYKLLGTDMIEFHIDSLSNGFRGCIDIVYGGICGLKPQIVVTTEKSFINNSKNTVYCGFDPSEMKPNQRFNSDAAKNAAPG